MTTTDRLTPQGRAFLKSIENLSKNTPYVKIGILKNRFGDQKSGDETIIATLGEVAISNEFGSPERGIPERSYIRSTFDENKEKWLGLMSRQIDKLIEGKTTEEKILATMGEHIKSEIQRKIVDLRTPPNSPETIAKKGSSNPLIDTGQLRQSIDYEVVAR